MKLDYKHRIKIVYLFILGAISLFVMFIALIISQNGVFTSKVYFYTTINNASGLLRHPPIKFKGYEIGKVCDFHLTDNNKIHVDFYIYTTFMPRVSEYSVLNLNNGFTGEIVSLELMVPPYDKDNHKILTTTKLIPLGITLEGADRIRAGGIIIEQSGVFGIIQKIDKMLGSINDKQTISNVNNLLTSVNSSMLEVTVMLQNYRDPANLLERVGGKDVREILVHLNSTLSYVKDIISVAHKNRKDISPLIINANKTIKRLDKTLQGVNNNPFLRAGISHEKKYIGVEIND